MTRTAFQVAQRFCWPTIFSDKWALVSLCSVCNSVKVPRKPPSGYLPVPSRPWSHIAMEIITRLPNFKGNTVILPIIDRFYNWFTQCLWGSCHQPKNWLLMLPGMCFAYVAFCKTTFRIEAHSLLPPSGKKFLCLVLECLLYPVSCLGS